MAYEITENEQQIKAEMKKGISYPAARKMVINSDILDTPNNILAIEYLKSAKLPCTAVRRIGKGHDSDDEKFSASEIRKKLTEDEICSMKNCETAVLAKLRCMTANDFLKIEDVTEGLENRIVDMVKVSTSLETLYDNIKTKNPPCGGIIILRVPRIPMFPCSRRFFRPVPQKPEPGHGHRCPKSRVCRRWRWRSGPLTRVRFLRQLQSRFSAM